MPEHSSASPDAPGRFARTIDFVGAAGFARLQGATVAVAGLGGVGSHAACLLARSGVGALRLIDFDRVTWSSLNRSAVALPEDVGRPKAEVVAAHLRRICPEVRLEVHQAFLHHDTASELLAAPLDFLIDAIDAEGPKVAVLAYCVDHDLPVVSCMGAAARADAALVRVADLADTTTCPLARNVRGKLKKLGITGGVTVVYSLERPRPSLPPEPGEEGIRRGRVRQRLPSLGTVPGVAGYAAAGVVIAHLAG
jgi:tRNA A37 threonylcarbamoyladenosine dehydratase